MYCLSGSTIFFFIQHSFAFKLHTAERKGTRSPDPDPRRKQLMCLECRTRKIPQLSQKQKRGLFFFGGGGVLCRVYKYNGLLCLTTLPYPVR